jgi:endonuclease/exonuclease/phosphatase family metal-dependent hydrolase
MKGKIFLISFLSLLICMTSMAQDIRVGTFNLRYANTGDTGNMWVNRAPLVASLIDFHDFDIFGTQEGLKNQIDDIQQALPAFKYYGRGRDDGEDKGEHSAIFYKTDRFSLLNKGDFWLSETPDKPSLGWDAKCCFRICSWVYLQDKKTKKKFYFFNAHYDHQGMQARRESSKLVLEKIKQIAGSQPAIFTGDLNGDQQSEWYTTLATSDMVKDSYTIAKNPYANNTSFNGFGSNLKRSGIIDHIFVTRQFAVKKWGILSDSFHGKFPSDHFPVMAIVEL